MANWTTFLFVSFSFPLFFCTVSLQLSTTLIEKWGGNKKLIQIAFLTEMLQKHSLESACGALLAVDEHILLVQAV